MREEISSVREFQDTLIVRTRTILSTHEYHICMNPETGKIEADVVEYGTWRDLDDDETLELISNLRGYKTPMMEKVDFDSKGAVMEITTLIDKLEERAQKQLESGKLELWQKMMIEAELQKVRSIVEGGKEVNADIIEVDAAEEEESNECGMKFIDYDKFLYPQNECMFEKTIDIDTWHKIQEVAEKKLEEHDDGRIYLASEVYDHMESIVNGHIPFGYKLRKE